MEALEIIKQALLERGAINFQDSANDPNGVFDLHRSVSFTLNGRVYEIEIGRARNHGNVGK